MPLHEKIAFKGLLDWSGGGIQITGARVAVFSGTMHMVLSHKKLKRALCDVCVTPRWCYVAQFMHAVTF